MIKSKKDLEDKVLEYSPQVRERVNSDSNARRTLEEIAGEEYKSYQPFIGGATQKAGSVGRALGYAGDAIFWGSAIAATVNPLFAPYMLTGLVFKKAQLIAQAPEALKTIKYSVKSGDAAGGVMNIGAKAISYLPGATFVDRGLSKIAEKRMVKSTAYKFNERLGVESKPWYHRTAEEAEKAGYTDVKVRSENIIRPDLRREIKRERELKRAA